jgi:hypothetical protein
MDAGAVFVPALYLGNHQGCLYKTKDDYYIRKKIN